MMTYPDPDQLAASAVSNWRAGGEPVAQVLTFPRPWLPDAEDGELTVTYLCKGRKGHAEAPELSAIVQGEEFSLCDPVLLEPVEISKPWGREIWHTGIETRGESRVRGTTGSLGLGSYLALAPGYLCRNAPLVLLKVLDPHPEPVVGELYLEVHTEKRELYVVTWIDPNSWPEGCGEIRYGVNQALRRQFNDDDGFRRAFVVATENYERIRRAVDAGKSGLAGAEQAAREATLAFTESRDLVVGDVVSIPTLIPHSLQPGVRVVEFQTPVYERKIISASQKVLTQDRWDSADAIAHLSLDPPRPAGPEPVAAGIERIGRFEDFNVWRARLSEQNSLRLPPHVPYALALCISGELRLTGSNQTLTLQRDEAAFIPAAARSQPITGANETLVLLAAPGL